MELKSSTQNSHIEESSCFSIEQFLFIAELGEGSQGVVKEVLHVPTNNYYAMKVCSFFFWRFKKSSIFLT